MIAKENLVTLDRPDGFRIVRRLGAVTGAGSRPQSMLQATFRSIGAFVGLAPSEYLSGAEKAREEALEHLRRQAAQLGADAVVELHFEAAEEVDGSTRVAAHGEAVVLERGTT